MSKIIDLKEAAKKLPNTDQPGRNAHIGAVEWQAVRAERDAVGRGADYHSDVGTAARLIADHYVKDPAAYGPRGWPQVGGIFSARAAAEALVLHSKQSPMIRANLISHHEELSKLGLTDPRANPPEMDAVIERLVHQVQHYHPEALDMMRKRTRGAIFDPLDLSTADSRTLIARWLEEHGISWLNLVFDEYGEKHGKPLPEGNDELRALAIALWPMSEAAAAVPRWSLSEKEVSDEIDQWLEYLSVGEISDFFDVQP